MLSIALRTNCTLCSENIAAWIDYEPLRSVFPQLFIHLFQDGKVTNTIILSWDGFLNLVFGLKYQNVGIAQLVEEYKEIEVFLTNDSDKKQLISRNKIT